VRAGGRVMLVVRAEGDDAGWTDRRRTTPVDVHVFVVQVHVDDDRRRRRTRRLPDDVQAHHSDVVRRPVVVRIDELAALLGCSTTASSPVSDQPRRRGGPRAAVADTSGPGRVVHRPLRSVSRSVGLSVSGRTVPYVVHFPRTALLTSLSLSFSVSRMPCFLNTHSACSAYITLYKYYLIVYK